MATSLSSNLRASVPPSPPIESQRSPPYCEGIE